MVESEIKTGQIRDFLLDTPPLETHSHFRGAAPPAQMSRNILRLFYIDSKTKVCYIIEVSDKKKWTKEQWREWGKRKKERDERYEEMNRQKQGFGRYVIDNHWHE